MKAVLIYDGDCGICTDSAKWTRKHLRDRESVRITPFQAEDLDAYGLTLDDVTSAAWWIDPDGRKWRGHLAAARAFGHCSTRWRILGRVLRTWPITLAAAALYRWVAQNRQKLSKGDAACEPVRSQSRLG